MRRGARWTAEEEAAGEWMASNVFAVDGTSPAASAEAGEDGATSDASVSSAIERAAAEAPTDSDGMGRDR